MEGICRACLVKFNDLSEFNTYSEKNRRLFVYATGIQVKRNDAITFQLCKACYSHMKTSCSFKKSCRTSDRKLKIFLYLKESGDGVDFSDYLKNCDDTALRFPTNNEHGTPSRIKNKEDDNVSTTTSIQNFTKDFLQADEIPDNEAQIIREVIQEEADVSDNSLDSHWLQDDVSVDPNFRWDFSFSPFSTPHSIINDHCYTLQANIYNNEEGFKEQICNQEDVKLPDVNPTTDVKEFESKNDKDKSRDIRIEGTQNWCVIDKNLEKALRDGDTDNFSLDAILATPPMIPNAWAPSTPTINNILFGEKLEDVQKSGHHIEKFEDVEGTINNVLDEFITLKDLLTDAHPEIEIKTKKVDNENLTQENMEISKSRDDFIKTNPYEELNQEESINVKDEIEESKVFKKPLSPIENKCSLKELYCKICDIKLKTSRGLKLHMFRKHKLKVTEKMERKREKMICDYCGKICTTKKLFIKHIAFHMNPEKYRCRTCSLTFSTEARLRMHQTTHAGVISKKPVDKKHVCTVCGVACSSASNYAMHARRHTGQFKCTCNECGMGFYRQGDLTVHMRKHTGERPYGCAYCDKMFARHNTLNKHMKLHTGEQPHVCKFCGKRFSAPYNLYVHQKSVQCMRIQEKIAEVTMEN